MQIVCLDLEGVLIPEIWVQFARRSGIDGLLRTTRDEPDYDKLMKYRLNLLDEHKLRINDIQEVIDTMSPLPGAAEFLAQLRQDYQVVILSDTFYQFARPLLRQLDWPTVFCHRLKISDDGRIADYRLRMPDQKRAAVKSLKALNFRVFAAGDSYNDLGMLQEADAGFFIYPPDSIASEFPHFPVMQSHAQLRGAIDDAAARYPVA